MKEIQMEWIKTKGSSPANLKREFYAFVSLYVHLLELATGETEISGQDSGVGNLEMKMAAALRQEEILLRNVVSVTRMRL
ncbi:MAG: hypothetical protein WCK00_17890 [Deltaproteobacteria bacterium]